MLDNKTSIFNVLIYSQETHNYKVKSEISKSGIRKMQINAQNTNET